MRSARPQTTSAWWKNLRDTGFHYWPASTSTASSIHSTKPNGRCGSAHHRGRAAPGTPHLAWAGWQDVLDPSGVNHGRAAQIWRRLEKVMPERDLLDRYGDEVEHGHVCIGVRCGSRDSRDLVAGVLGRHGGHLISISRWVPSSI